MQEHCQGSDAAVFTLDTTASYKAVVGYFAFHGKQRKSIFEENEKRERERKQGSVLVCRVATIVVVTASIGVPPDRSVAVFC
jgi:hypothetical protein